MQRLTRYIVGLVACAAAITLFTPTARAQFDHGAVVLRRTFGPTGVAAAHVGEPITSITRVLSMDDFNDTVIVTSVVCVVHHRSGDVATTNLLSPPVVLPGFGDFVQCVSTYQAQATDGDFLGDHGLAGSIDNFDGLHATYFPIGSFASYPAQTRILRPCLQVSRECLAGNGFTVRLSTVANCGNCTLTNVVISNLVNGVSTRLFGPATLAANQTVRLTNSFAAAPAVDILSAGGTDELGLTVSDSAMATCPNVADAFPKLMASHALGKIGLEFESITGRFYTVQWIDSLKPPVTNWQALSNFLGTGSTLSLGDGTSRTQRYYRVLSSPGEFENRAEAGVGLPTKSP